MKILLALYFFILATIQIGLLLGTLHYYYSRHSVKPSFYWIGSLGSSATGLMIFGLGIISLENAAKPNFGFTVANTLFYMATLFQGLFCRSLHLNLSKKIKMVAGFSILLFVVGFDLMRIHANFEIRTIFMVGLVFVLLNWQIYELKHVSKTNASHQLIYLQYATVIEILFALARWFVLIPATFYIQQVEELPQSLIFFTIAQLVANTISYTAISGYWAEKVAISNAQASLENEVIKKLLVEREKMISHLSVANKSAVTGALSASIAAGVRRRRCRSQPDTDPGSIRGSALARACLSHRRRCPQ